MKIAIPVDDNNNSTTVCISFGRTPYFLLYNTVTKEHTYLDNSAISSQGGAGIKASQTLVDNHVEALLTPRCGENAAKVLVAANIKIYKTTDTSLEKTLSDFEEGKLDILEEIHPGFHNHQ